MDDNVSAVEWTHCPSSGVLDSDTVYPQVCHTMELDHLFWSFRIVQGRLSNAGQTPSNMKGTFVEADLYLLCLSRFKVATVANCG